MFLTGFGIVAVGNAAGGIVLLFEIFLHKLLKRNWIEKIQDGIDNSFTYLLYKMHSTSEFSKLFHNFALGIVLVIVDFLIRHIYFLLLWVETGNFTTN